MDFVTVWWNKVFASLNVPQDSTTVATPSDNALSDTRSEDGVALADGGLRGLQRLEKYDYEGTQSRRFGRYGNGGE